MKEEDKADFLKAEVLSQVGKTEEVLEDIKISKKRDTPPMTRIIQYLKEKGWPEECPIKKLHSKYLLIYWIALNDRSIKTKLLFIYGKPFSQKSLIIHFLFKIFSFYFVNSSNNKFPGSDDFYDL